MDSIDPEFAPLAVNPPYLDTIDVSSPAAGANARYTVPGETWCVIVAARALLTTSSAVADRFVSLDYIDGRGTTRVRNAAGLTVQASTSALAFEWNTGRTIAEWATGTPILAPCLDVMLPPASVVQVTIDNRDTGDQLSGVHLLVVKVATGPPWWQRNVHHKRRHTSPEMPSADRWLRSAPMLSRGYDRDES